MDRNVKKNLDGAVKLEVDDQIQNNFVIVDNLVVWVYLPSFVQIDQPCLWTPIIGHCMVFSETGC